jgi:hypothetical protein
MYPKQGGIDAKASADALGVGRDHHRDGDDGPRAGDSAGLGEHVQPHRIGGRGRFNTHRQVPETHLHEDATTHDATTHDPTTNNATTSNATTSNATTDHTTTHNATTDNPATHHDAAARRGDVG